MSGEWLEGMIIAAGGGLYRVKVGESILTCSPRGRLRHEAAEVGPPSWPAGSAVFLGPSGSERNVAPQAVFIK